MTEPYFVVDLETTVRNMEVGEFRASPWCWENDIIAMGVKRRGTDCALYYAFHGLDPQSVPYSFPSPVGDEIVVAHNAKFDLSYLRRASPTWERWLAHGRVWDTQLAEYLLSGQSHKYPSLNECAALYGGTQKDTLIAEYWESGVQTEDIPREQLLDYLRADVLNTELVYLAQRKRAEEMGMEALIWANMEALLATADMEYNGMWFDAESARAGAEKLEAEMVQVAQRVSQIFAIHLPWSVVPNASSRDQLSKVLFGGELSVVEPVIMLDPTTGTELRYKTGPRRGELKTKGQNVTYGFGGFDVKPKAAWATSKPGVYQVNDGVLAELRDHPQAGTLVQLVLEYRRLEKDISTYYRGYAGLTWPDGCIHPSLEHCSTSTGRLSCTKPNLQNVTGA